MKSSDALGEAASGTKTKLIFIVFNIFNLDELFLFEELKIKFYSLSSNYQSTG